MSKTVQPSKKQRSELQRYVDKWRSILFLHGWDFRLVFSSDTETTAAADIKMQTVYKHAHITVYPNFWAEQKEYREEIIVHELVHCLIQPLIELAHDSSDGKAVSVREINLWKETVTQNITNALFWSKK